MKQPFEVTEDGKVRIVGTVIRDNARGINEELCPRPA